MSTNPHYAGFWVRLLAHYTEGLLWLLVFSYGFFYVSSSSSLALFWLNFVTYAVLFLFPVGLLNVFIRAYLTSKFGGGIGKLLTGLRVEDSDHNLISFKRSLFRYTVGYLFSSVLLFLGFISIAKDSQKRAFHDKAVGSYVIIRQALWPFALILMLILFFINVYFLTQGINKIVSGPIKFEIMQLVSDFQQQAQNLKETPSAIPTPKEASSSATTPGTKPGGNVIFVALKENTTETQAQPLVKKLQANPAVLKVQFLNKDQALAAYQSVAPNKSVPLTNLPPVIIVILKDSSSNAPILDEIKTEKFVQTAYPYSI